LIDARAIDASATDIGHALDFADIVATIGSEACANRINATAVEDTSTEAAHTLDLAHVITTVGSKSLANHIDTGAAARPIVTTRIKVPGALRF
jgi:hypothetical protein